MNDEDKIAELEARVKDLEAVLRQHNGQLHVTFQLTPALSDILGLLLQLPVVTPDMIQQRLGIVSDTKVAIYRLRTALKGFNVQVHSKRHLGYWLDPETKARVRAKLAEESRVEDPVLEHLLEHPQGTEDNGGGDASGKRVIESAAAA